MYLFEIGTLSCFFIHVYGCGEAFPECWVAGNSHFFFFLSCCSFSLAVWYIPMFASWMWLCEGALRHSLILFRAVFDIGVLSCCCSLEESPLRRQCVSIWRGEVVVAGVWCRVILGFRRLVCK